MAIALTSAGTFTERTAEASTAVPYPATVTADDLLVLGGSVANLGLITAPGSPWVTVANMSATGSTQTPDLLGSIKKALGTESGSLSVSHHNNVSAWQMIGFSGVDTTNPQDATATTYDATGSNTVLPSITIATTGSALVYIAALNSTTGTATVPSGFTETADLTTGTRAFTMGYKLGLATGATGTVTVAWSGSGRNIGVLIALRPVVAGSVYGRVHYATTVAPAPSTVPLVPIDVYRGKSGQWSPTTEYKGVAGEWV